MSKKPPKKEYIDPRVKRTRQLLRKALIELIPEKGYNSITIKDITDHATLNRATFYLHYRDKEDLLLRGFDEIWDELTEDNPLPIDVNGSISSEGTRETVHSDFKHLAEYYEFYRVMLSEHGAAEFIHRLQDHVHETTAKRLAAVLGELPSGPVPLEMALRFISSAYVGIIKWWLEEGKPYTPEEMSSLFVNLYSITPFRALGIEMDSNVEGLDS